MRSGIAEKIFGENSEAVQNIMGDMGLIKK